MKGLAFSRSFSLMILGQIITLFGSSILRFALSLFILDITGSAATFGIILAISTIPTIVFSPIGGAVADRINRRNLMVLFDLVSGVLVGGFAFLLFRGEPSIILIGTLMTLLSIVSTFYQPTVQASIPTLVDKKQLLKANGIVSGVSAITNFAGPVLGGLIYGLTGIEIIVVITCTTFFLAAVAELFIKMPFEKLQQTHGAVKTILLDIKEGALYLIKVNPVIFRIIVIAAAMNLFITPLFLVGVPYIVKIVLGMNDSFFGFTQGGISLSMIVAAAAVGFVVKKLNIRNLYMWFIASGLLFVPMALSIHPIFTNPEHSQIIQYVVFSLCTMSIMFAITIINIFIMTMLQQQTPNELLGKVMAILTAVSTCAVPIGQILFGTLIDSFANTIYFLIFAVAIITVAIALVTKKLFKGNGSEYSEDKEEFGV